MNINKNESVDYYDVDGTLIIHEKPENIPAAERIQVYDTITKKFIIVRINRPMVRLLMESKSRGSYVRVWSRGGWRWASDVIKALDLVDYVDSVESKPMAYFDDTPVEKWLPYRVFIEPDVIYKKINKVQFKLNNQTKET